MTEEGCRRIASQRRGQNPARRHDPVRLKNTVYFNELNERVNEKIPTANVQQREQLCSKARERSTDMLRSKGMSS
jgi:hypothetical protein